MQQRAQPACTRRVRQAAGEPGHGRHRRCAGTCTPAGLSSHTQAARTSICRCCRAPAAPWRSWQGQTPGPVQKQGIIHPCKQGRVPARCIAALQDQLCKDMLAYGQQAHSKLAPHPERAKMFSAAANILNTPQAAVSCQVNHWMLPHLATPCACKRHDTSGQTHSAAVRASAVPCLMVRPTVLPARRARHIRDCAARVDYHRKLPLRRAQQKRSIEVPAMRTQDPR